MYEPRKENVKPIFSCPSSDLATALTVLEQLVHLEFHVGYLTG